MKKRPALLDVNVLIALFDATHVHHEAAHDWFADHKKQGWATCPLTENGFLRVMTHPRAGIEEGYHSLRAGLATFCSSAEHVFWADAVSLGDERLFNPSVLLTHRQITDVYLLGLVKRMGGRLATFDSRIPLKAVRGATMDDISVIAPVE